jgi:hypothetical protein
MIQVNPLQHYLLEEISKRFLKKTDAVDVLCQLLNVGKDAIYRRMRGDTVLSPAELTLLAAKLAFHWIVLCLKTPIPSFLPSIPFVTQLKHLKIIWKRFIKM